MDDSKSKALVNKFQFYFNHEPCERCKEIHRGKPYDYWDLRVNPPIGHFRVPKKLSFKARLSAKLLIWKWFLIMMQIKFIFTTNVSHFASFWKWDFLELGNGLFHPMYTNKVDWLIDQWKVIDWNSCPPPPGADLGFFLGGGALVSCSTSTTINHRGCAPPAPSP